MAGIPEINLNARVVRAKHTFSQEVDDDVVILHVNRGQYFGSEIVGQHIWRLLATPIAVPALCDEIMTRFKGVDRPTCEQDLLEFLGALRAADLIDVLEE